MDCKSTGTGVASSSHHADCKSAHTSGRTFSNRGLQIHGNMGGGLQIHGNTGPRKHGSTETRVHGNVGPRKYWHVLTLFHDCKLQSNFGMPKNDRFCENQEQPGFWMRQTRHANRKACSTEHSFRRVVNTLKTRFNTFTPAISTVHSGVKCTFFCRFSTVTPWSNTMASVCNCLNI